MAAASDSAWRSRIDSSYSRRDGDDSIMFRTGAAPGAAQWRTRAWIEHYWPAFRWQSDHVERSRSLDEPQSGPLVVIEAERIVYTEHWLRREGFAPRQFWTKPVQ